MSPAKKPLGHKRPIYRTSGEVITLRTLPAKSRGVFSAKNQLIIMNKVLKQLPLLEKVATRESRITRGGERKMIVMAAPKVRAFAQKEIESVLFERVSKRNNFGKFVDDINSSSRIEMKGKVKAYFNHVAGKEKITIPEAKNKIMSELMIAANEIESARSSTEALERFERMKAKKGDDPHRTAHVKITADAFGYAFIATSQKILLAMVEVGRTEPKM